MSRVPVGEVTRKDTPEKAFVRGVPLRTPPDETRDWMMMMMMMMDGFKGVFFFSSEKTPSIDSRLYLGGDVSVLSSLSFLIGL